MTANHLKRILRTSLKVQVINREFFDIETSYALRNLILSNFYKLMKQNTGSMKNSIDNLANLAGTLINFAQFINSLMLQSTNVKNTGLISRTDHYYIDTLYEVSLNEIPSLRNPEYEEVLDTLQNYMIQKDQATKIKIPQRSLILKLKKNSVKDLVSKNEIQKIEEIMSNLWERTCVFPGLCLYYIDSRKSLFHRNYFHDKSYVKFFQETHYKIFVLV